MGKSYKVTVFAGTKVVADMAQQVKNATIEASIQVKTIKGGATSATATILPPGPAGANRKMEDVTGWFVNGTPANPPAATGTPWEAETGFKNINWWDGTTGTWSLGSSVALPMKQGVPVINPTGSGLPTEKATADYVGIQVINSKQDVLNSIINNKIDVDTFPELTAKKYISAIGAVSDTTSNAWNATVQFESLRGATVLGYKGEFGTSSTRLAFYSAQSQASLVGVYPGADTEIKEQDFDIPAGAKYYRASVRNPVENGFKITLKNVPVIKSTPLISFEFVGNSFVYVNDVIQQANIIWNDGTTGRVVYGDWDDTQYCYKSFVATSVENNLQVTQPAVTFNSSGQITNYPKFIITSI